MAISGGCLLLAATAAGQQHLYNVDEEIEVQIDGQWRPAKVIQQLPKRTYKVMLSDTDEDNVGIVAEDELRGLWETDGLSRGQFWTDASGQFRMRAVVLNASGEEILFRKDDGAEVRVPLAKLSETSRQAIQRLRGGAEGTGDAASAAAFPEFPPAIVIETAATFSGFFASQPEDFAPLEDTPAAPATYRNGGGVFPLDDFFDTYDGVLLAGGSEGWVLGSVYSMNPSESRPSFLVWASSVRNRVAKRQLLPPGERVVDYDPASGLLATLNDPRTGNLRDAETLSAAGERDSQCVTVWRVDPLAAQPTGVARFDLGSASYEDPWVRILGADQMLIIDFHGSLVSWSIQKGEVLYSGSQDSFFKSPPALSASRKYLAIPQDRSVLVMETASGKTLRHLPIDQRLAQQQPGDASSPSQEGQRIQRKGAEGQPSSEPTNVAGVAFSADGRRLAAVTAQSIWVWDLTTEEPAQRFAAGVAGTPFQTYVSWLSDDLLLIADPRASIGFAHVYSLGAQMVVWRYDFDAMQTARGHFGARSFDLSGDRLAYAVEDRGPTNRIGIGTVSLYDPQIVQAIQQSDRAARYVFQPGDSLRLEVRADDPDGSIRAALEQKIKDNQWRLDPNAPNALIAEITRGAQTTEEYVESTAPGPPSTMGGRIGGQNAAPPPQQTFSITFTPYTSSVRLEIGGSVAWQAGATSGPPPILTTDGSARSLSGEPYSRPIPGFFQSLTIPAHVPDASLEQGLGSSVITAHGIQPGDRR